MATSSLQQTALRFASDLKQMRTLLPGLSDPDIIKVAQALNGGPPNGGQAAPARDLLAPATLAEAVVIILTGAKQAHRGEIRRAIENKGWSHLAGDKDLDGSLGRVLASDGAVFERIHRGLYRLSKAVKAPNPKWGEDAALEISRKLEQPFMAHQLASQMHVNVFQACAWLKILKKKKLVKVASTDVNGTAHWAVVQQ